MISLTPQTEARLRERAERDGTDINTAADAMIVLGLDWEEWDFEDTVAGVRRGLQDVAEGRTKPLEQVIAEARAKHGFSEQWPFDGGMK